ncbi:ABC transporter [Virgisporangium aliadipatigenens]|uniref:ABC transporter n=1 Tax=Virgisporangium aliadipatigenens TaxID=741659 RepID=A0A8J3YM41_9ACTN|nr:ABC transporter permease [Virgisporangium aliadipatigenens]GIJ46623.1 ABC transporter [Virgisporangium aliadipatigenens]
MLRATLKSVLSRKLRLVLSGLAVVLGVMFVSGAFVLTDTLGRSFDGLFATAFQNTDVTVSVKSTGPAQGFDDDQKLTATVKPETLEKVRGIDGVAKATGIVSADGARVIGSNGKVITSFGPPRLGENWTGENDLVKLREGRAPQSGTEVVMNAGLAKSAGVKVGDQVGVLTTQPKKTFTLVGITEYSGGRDSLGGSMVVSFHESVAAELMLGTPNVYSSVDVKAAAGKTPEQVRDSVRAALGDSFEVKTGAELQKAQTAGAKEALGFFNKILLGFAGVALFVGTFLILNTFSIIVAQRTRELALMRAIGASRKQMIGSVLVEAVLIGLFASAVGLGLGIGVGSLLAWVFGNVGSASLELAGIGVPPAAIISAFSVGMIITLVAALLPAMRASRIPPVAALQEAATPDRPLTKVTVVGSLVTAGGATLLLLGLNDKLGDSSLYGFFGGVLLAFIGIALLTPMLARPIVGVIGRLMAWSVPGKLGRLNSARNPRRTAITAAALMVGIALITGVNTVFTSAEASIQKIADKEVNADLIISGDPSDERPATFDPAVIDKTKAISGVTGFSADYFDVAHALGEDRSVTIMTDVPAYAKMFKLTAKEGEIRALGPDEVLYDEERAKEKGLHVGATIEVQLARGQPRQMKLVGIYAKSSTTGGLILPTTLIGELQVAQPSWGYVDVADGVSVDGVRKQVDALLADSPEVTVANRNDFVQQQTSAFDTVLLMVQILLALAVLIAVLGIINTLALSVLERTRELGLLRAIGLGRFQSMRMITVEAIVISVFGALLGVVVGSGLGAAIVRALKDDGFSTFAMPWTAMGTYLALGAGIGVIAAILPALRAARVNVLQAISYE